jgi:tRNA 2-thiocytidine biosynthesis protein TtcA
VLRERAQSYGIKWESIFFPISEEAKGKVDCFYCALRRRTALFKLAFKEGYNKVAFGHHLDDIVETLLMNVMHHGNVSTMSPRVDLFKGQISIIRPLAYVLEAQCRDYANSQVFVPPACKCAGMDDSVRRDTKEFIARMEVHFPDAKQRLFEVLRHAAK